MSSEADKDVDVNDHGTRVASIIGKEGAHTTKIHSYKVCV